MTQFGVVLIVVVGGHRTLGRPCAGRTFRRRRPPFISACAGREGSSLALAAVFPLAAVQLWPTARLAGLAASQRDFEYLSGFASTPFHLVNFVAPGLFHRSPLWRPLVWDPFHTSPEEHLAYIGLVPLFLAVHGHGPRVAPRRGGPAAGDPGHRDACPESRSLSCRGSGT